MTHGSRLGEGDPTRPGPAGAGQGVLLHQRFAEASVTSLRGAVSAAVSTAGLSDGLAEDFVLAVHELVTNAVRHGGGKGTLDLRLLADVLTCEIVDCGGPAGGLPVRLSPTDRPGGRGLWLAHQLTGSLMLTQRPDGVTASVSVCVTASPAVSSSPASTDAVAGPSPSEGT
ncbi:ATP-binding protein [Actinoplanes sp. NPDC049668]|uniref:ATP-binding protein n=1 Tax=unclassified Actinoplanes TaxID=2626549 RepID=UPI0033B86C64